MSCGGVNLPLGGQICLVKLQTEPGVGANLSWGGAKLKEVEMNLPHGEQICPRGGVNIPPGG